MEKAPPNKEESSGGNKKATTITSSSQIQQEQQQQQILKCPRCDSMNTKFCYYNNYSLTQPRHFCKSCRRYWTKGGSLRNVPIGGGCRKSKKLKPLSLNSSRDSPTSSDHIGRLNFFHGLSSSSSPTIDFHLGGLSIPRLNLTSSPSSGVVYNQLSSIANPSFQDIEGSNSSLGFNFSFPPLFKQQSENNVSYDVSRTQDEAFVGTQVAVSIESLSSINQDLHWKLQQQRFASMLFGGNNNINSNENNVVSQGLNSLSINHHHEIQRPQPILFQNLDLSSPRQGGSWENYSRKDGQSDNLENGYFFDDDTCAPTMNSTRSPSSNGANNGDDTAGWNNGAHAWNNLHQFNALP